MNVLMVVEACKESAALVGAMRTECDVATVASVRDACQETQRHTYNAVVLSHSAWIAEPSVSARLRDGAPLVVIAMSSGAGDASSIDGIDDWIDKPWTTEKLRALLARISRYQSLASENRRLRQRLQQSERSRLLVGCSSSIEAIREQTRMLADSRVPVVIRGESGTGKEVVAREIHRLSDRCDERLVTVNCAAVPKALLEDELFGREEIRDGSVVTVTTGRLERANRGTLILDELCDMPLDVQARLLPFVESGTITPVGSGRSISVDVRLITISSRSLQDEVRAGRFRQDLFYRLNVVPIEIAPLRDRREDIPLLVEHFADALAIAMDRDPVRFTDGAMEALRRAEWRGNVRELENTIERFAILAPGSTLDENALDLDGGLENDLSRVESTFRNGSIRQMEKLMIMRRLADHEQNRTHTAKTLEISVRTLRNKLREYREQQHDPVLV